MADERTIQLFQSRDDRGTRSIWATTLADGRLKLEGQDLGASVAIFGEGFTEYEWAWMVAADDVPRLPAAFGGKLGDDPIPLLRHWIKQGNGRDPGQHLKNEGFAVEFWSRIGD
ncbi:MAG TPA: hypothetical protein VMQ65_08115 [Candidatus Limnocylindria bacterium]|nr:hypothetical protein [Candidatus Limnocylindria bacterium]